MPLRKRVTSVPAEGPAYGLDFARHCEFPLRALQPQKWHVYGTDVWCRLRWFSWSFGRGLFKDPLVGTLWVYLCLSLFGATCYSLWRWCVACLFKDVSRETPDVTPCRTSPPMPFSFGHVSREMPDVTPCRTSPPQGMVRKRGAHFHSPPNYYNY